MPESPRQSGPRDEPARSASPDVVARLIALIRHIGFGAIEGLHVVAGQPVFDPAPRIVQEVKFGPEFRQAPLTRPAAPTSEDEQLLAALASIGDGVIERVEIRHGLPFRLVRTVQEPGP